MTCLCIIGFLLPFKKEGVENDDVPISKPVSSFRLNVKRFFCTLFS